MGYELVNEATICSSLHVSPFSYLHTLSKGDIMVPNKSANSLTTEEI